jgi:hypothetical protein
MNYAKIALFLILLAPELGKAAIYHHPIKNTLTNDISCCIADIKFDGQHLAICEFGEGIESRFKGYDSLFGDGTMWQNIWHTLASFQRPLHYLGDDLLQEPKKSFGYETLKHQAKLWPTLAAFVAVTSKKASPSKALVIAHSIKQSLNPLFALQEQHPQLLVLGQKTSHYVRSKQATNSLFTTDFLQTFKPKTITLEKKYTPTLAQEIHQAISAPFLVIKPPCSAKGQGVVLIAAEELDAVLQKIMLPKKELSSKDIPSAFRYWQHDKSKTIIVEAFAASKPITVENKQYDATLRAVFVLSNLQGNMCIQHLGAYWKLPVKSLFDHGSFIEKHKSSVSSSRLSSARVDQADYEVVCAQLNLLLPALYEKMLAKNQ